ncbi:PRKR-interacting 1 -like protein [Brachionus plicatilis]|uniref:PRKR-interacting 1-like protein n=1 Tax=Brachionus plicatilis TaxID=10195 RepID=A0A3M7P996_BRAPC|nr:PRKR-interacting 1 -like protein [Brachionus plicatilis]
MNDLSSDDEKNIQPKKGPKTVTDIQRETIEKLMKDPNQEVFLSGPNETEQDVPIDTKRALNPHEFVRNVMGASAGAGSGEFDIYRGCRNRERLRQEFIKQQAEREKAQKEFEEIRLKNIAEAEKRTAKKRAKRIKAKEKLKSKFKKVDNIDQNTQDTNTEEEEIDLTEKVEENTEEL